jgi:hypothetical protein
MSSSWAGSDQGSPLHPVPRGAAAGVAVLALVAAYLVVGLARGTPDERARATAAAPPPAATPTPEPECALQTAGGERPLNSAQAKAAATLAAVAHRRGIGQSAVASALDIVLGEAWRKALPERFTAGYAAAILAGRTGTAAAADGAAAARALDGRRPGVLTCAYPRRLDLPEQAIGPTGLTRRAAALRARYEEVFGALPAGGFAPGGVRRGHVDNSAHYDGRAIDVFFRPASLAHRRDGWVFAQWLVAHADTYDVLSIIFDDRIWTVWASFAGWRPYLHPSGNTSNPVLRHLEHVHVAVVRGGSPNRPPGQ